MSKQTSGLGFVGQSVKRVEDERLLTGGGRFVADVDPPGVLHAAFARSPFPHADIVSVDVTAARRSPGVAAVFTGAEINAITHPFPPLVMLPGLYTPLFQAMTDDRVRMTGDLVALVLADSRHLAEDALELIEIDYEHLEPVADMAAALKPSSPPLWDKAGSNVVYDATDTYGDVESVFADADRVITERFSCPRQSNQPMETRGTVIEVDAATGHLTIHSATQSSHFLRWIASALTGKQSFRESMKQAATNKERRKAFTAGMKGFLEQNKEGMQAQDNAGAKDQMKKDRSLLKTMSSIGMGLLAKDSYPTVVAADIGGGFGAKGAVGREDVALMAAALELGRSVKWIEDRVENLTDGGQAREEDLTVSIAVDNDGTLRGMRVDMILDQGAYPGFPIGAPMITRLMKVMFPGTYDFEAYELRSRIVTTNKGRYLAYRGPWANETWVRERMLDVVARALRVSPAELRLKNMFGDEHMPTNMITGPTLDITMSTRKTLEHAIDVVDLAGF
ncbi:MAG: molybdopterin-dependent oxidoreductase, partial [Actinomycetota bacterium]|nr:molybdopterin-dependent oxidoreductase [Actinomycetota bacterium]